MSTSPAYWRLGQLPSTESDSSFAPRRAGLLSRADVAAGDTVFFFAVFLEEAAGFFFA
jgi:hypothetical protein